MHAKPHYSTTVCILTHPGRQSPINIVTANVRQDTSLSDIVFSANWGTAITHGQLINNGHTVKFTLDDRSPTIFTRFPVGFFRLKQFHFHWGRRSATGSEHLINGRRFELEIHFVHERIYGSGDALAVIGVLADVSVNPISGVWETLQVSNLKEPNDHVTIADFTLSNLLPTNRDYYNYPGSLTTPPCTESVQWYVLKNRITVPYAYLAALRGLNTDCGYPLTYNYRMVQPLGSRTVTTPRKYKDEVTTLLQLLMKLV